MSPLSLIRAFVWLVVLVAALGKASALLDHDYWPANYPPGGVVAVDLGNTNSCVAGYESGETTGTMFRKCIPSWVAFADDGTVLVGEDAVNHAAVNPGAAVSGFKRLLGKRFDRVFERDFAQSVKDNLSYKVVEENAQLHIEVKTTTKKDGSATNVVVGVEQLTAAVLAKLKETAEARIGYRVEAAILTLPLHFSDDASRSAAVFAARLAGLRAMRAALSEPVAASIAYGLSGTLRDEGNVAVLHVGGGTAEASVMTFVDGVYEALSSQYDPFFGGHDFDRRIVDHFVGLVRGKDIAGDGAALEKLRTACERAKKTLSHRDHAQVTVESLVDGVELSELLTRAEFEELNHDLVHTENQHRSRQKDIASLS